MKLNNVKVLDMKDGEVEKISYEGEEYSKVSGEAQVGDVVLNLSDRKDALAGQYYEVVYNQLYGWNTVIDDAGDKHSNIIHDSEIFRKPARKGRVGDVVKITKGVADLSVGEYEITGIDNEGCYEVKSEYGTSYVSMNEENSAYTYEIIPKEQAQKAEEAPKSGYAVGKYVIFDEDGWDITAGKAYKITEFSGGEFFLALDDKGDVQSFRMFSEKEAHKVVEFIEGSPQVGDKILVVNPVDASYYGEGDILTVDRADFPHIHSVDVITDSGHNCHLFRGEFEITERAGAEESPTKPAETKRKPGEFKAGDIAKVIGTGYTDEIIGRYVTVKTEPKGSIRGGNVVVSDGKNTVLILGDDLEFVTRVEDRADL